MLNKIRKSINTDSSSKFTFSIIIPSWNNIEYLKLCLNSIKENSSFNHQIIVMVNEGSDGTIDWLEKQVNVDFIHAEKNIGICYALNLGRGIVRTDYVVYANDDMYFLPKWDLYLKENIDKIGHNEFMLSATMIEPANTGNSAVIVRDYGDSLETFQRDSLLEEFESLSKDDWYGSTWPPNVLHVDTWDLVGGMSIEFSPGMYSDPDLSMKLWQAGIRYFRGVGDSRVYHFCSKSTERVKHNEGKDMFLFKWGITSRFFVDKYLKRGQNFQGPLPDYNPAKIEKIINNIKRVFRAI